MNKRGYVYFIEIIFAVVLATALFTSLQVTSIPPDRNVEINSLIAYDLLRELNNHDIINDDTAYDSEFIGYFIDSYLPDNFDYNITNGEVDVTGLSNQDLAHGEYTYRNSVGTWETINLYIWSKL